MTAIKWNARHIEVAVARLFDPRRNLIVPNVSWGLGLNHECDLLMISPAGYATEVEIKVSAADLKADFKKSHGHKSRKIKYLYYAMPKHILEKHQGIIPPECGLISVEEKKYEWIAADRQGIPTAKVIRRAKAIKPGEIWSDKDILALLRNLQVKYWTLKYQNRVL